MSMHEIATLSFTDQETQDEGVAVVRASSSTVSVALSLREGSDVEVFLAPEDAQTFLQALQTAAAECQPHPVPDDRKNA